jgi:hypothetical protein
VSDNLKQTAAAVQSCIPQFFQRNSSNQKATIDGELLVVVDGGNLDRQRSDPLKTLGTNSLGKMKLGLVKPRPTISLTDARATVTPI